MNELRGVDPSTDQFSEIAQQLSKEVRDHLDEEEHGTFQLAGKLLSKSRQEELASGYRAEYAKRGDRTQSDIDRQGCLLARQAVPLWAAVANS